MHKPRWNVKNNIKTQGAITLLTVSFQVWESGRFSSFLAGWLGPAAWQDNELHNWTCGRLKPCCLWWKFLPRSGGAIFWVAEFLFQVLSAFLWRGFPAISWVKTMDTFRFWVLKKSVCYSWLEDSKNHQGILRRVLSFFLCVFRRFATSGATCGTNWRRSCDVRSGVNWRRNVWQTRPMNCQLA